MYKITDTTLKSGVYSALTSQTREFCHRLSFGVGTGANFSKQFGFEKGITKIEISQEGNGDSGGLVFGSCCASSCVAEFYNPDKTYNYNGKTLFVECGVKYPFDLSYTDKSGGYYLETTGKWVKEETIYVKVTNLIPVFEGDIFVYTGRGEWGVASVLWYDADKNFLSAEKYASDSGERVATATVEAPEGAAWVLFQSFAYDPEITLNVSKSNDSFYYIPCGYYKVDKPETDDDWQTVKVTAYDGVDQMSGKWNTNLSMPSNAYLLFKEIANKYNFELDIESAVLSALQSRAVTESEALTLTSYTAREVCGFLAGLVGANARMNTVGKLAVKRYAYVPEDEFTITADVQWQNGFKKTAEEEFVINSITSGIDDAVFTAGTGRGISFANPIITEAEISEIYNMYAGASFQPSTCEWRGNPCIECGDTVYVTDKNGKSYTVFVASQDIDLTGGLSINTQCPGGDADISFDTVDERTRAALNKQKTELQKAIEQATDIITQTEGSIFELIPVNPDDPTQGNSGWKLYSEINRNVIIANSSGIGFSSDGGTTMNAAAIYIDENGEGHINANCINVGKMSAEFVEIESGSITVDKLTVGDFTNYCRVNDLSYKEWDFEKDGDWFVPNEPSSYNYLSDWIVRQNGLSYRFTGKVRSNAVYSGSYMGFGVGVRCKRADNTYTYALKQEYKASANKTEYEFDFTFTPGTSFKEIRFAIVNHYSGSTKTPDSGSTDISNVTIRSIGSDAGNIVAGKLQSFDGESYFDLDNGIIRTDNAQIVGGTVEIGGDDYRTEIKAGSITQHLKGSDNIIGGLVPVAAGSSTFQALYYRDSDGISLARQNSDGTFNYIFELNEDKVYASVPIESESTEFSGLSYTRKYTKNNVESSAKIKAGVGLWDDVLNPIDSKYLIYGGLIFKIYEGKPYWTTTLASADSVPLTEWIETNGSTTLNLSFYYHSYGYAFFDLVYKTETQIGTAYQTVASSGFLKSTKGDKDKTEGYYSGTFSIPSNAKLVSVWVRPENAASNYWAGWRNVKGSFFLGTQFSASLELLDANNNIAARLDVIEPKGAAQGALRIKSSRGSSSLLELGSDDMWFNGYAIYSTLKDLESRVATLENQ